MIILCEVISYEMKTLVLGVEYVPEILAKNYPEVS